MDVSPTGKCMINIWGLKALSLITLDKKYGNSFLIKEKVYYDSSSKIISLHAKIIYAIFQKYIIIVSVWFIFKRYSGIASYADLKKIFVIIFWAF